MKAPSLRVERVRVGELVSFADEAASNPAYAGVAPVTGLRAASMACNPCASPADVALLVALQGGRCVGYQGLLPGRLLSADGASTIHWLITLFVTPECRGQGIGRRLIAEALGLGVDLATVGPARAADAAYRSAGFKILGELRFRRFTIESFPRAVHGVMYAVLRAGRNPTAARSVPRIRPEVERQPEAVPRFARDANLVNWTLAHPWVASHADAPPQPRPYHFSHARDLFRQEAWETSARNGRRGAVVLSVARHRGAGCVKLLDLFLPPADSAAAVSLALQRAHEIRAGRIDFPAHAGPAATGFGFLPRLTRWKSRTTVYHPGAPDSPLARAAGTLHLDLCDGDAALT
jgi:GNAT superfamily N-acetyltransferase